MSCKWSCPCMRGNCGLEYGPAEIIGQPASVKMALIMVTPILKQQLDAIVYAWWVRILLRLSHLTSYAPHRVTSPEGCACTMCVSISQVSDLCVIILCSRKRAGMPTWCPLDKGHSWHLSVSGRPSVAPSISLADSRGPGASLTPSLHRLYATLPALAESHLAARTWAHECKDTHTDVLRATLQESGDLEGNVSPWQTMTPAPFRHYVLSLCLLSSTCLVLPLFLPGHLFSPPLPSIYSLSCLSSEVHG